MVEPERAQDAPRVRHMGRKRHRDADPVGERERRVHRGAQQPDHRDVDREPPAVHARIEGVGGDHRVVAVLRRPEDFAHDRGRLHHVMEAVERALRADGEHHLRAREVVGEADLDLGAGRGIAVEQLLDRRDVVRLLRLLGARLLIDEEDAHEVVA